MQRFLKKIQDKTNKRQWKNLAVTLLKPIL